MSLRANRGNLNLINVIKIKEVGFLHSWQKSIQFRTQYLPIG